MTKRKQYSAEFKRQAVELLENRDKTGTEVAKQLGVKQNQLYKWREELKQKGDEAFKGPRRLPANQRDEVSRLKEENKQLREELEILKKAAIYFAKELP